MVRAFNLATVKAKISTTLRRPAVVALLIALLITFTYFAVRLLFHIKSDYQEADYSLAQAIRNSHDFPRSERLIDELITATFYNRPQTSLNESLPLTMRISANPAVLAHVMSCRAPQRVELKARVIAPNLQADNSLDEAVPIVSGVHFFSWMLTPRQSGLQEARVRGIVYCISPVGRITTRETVVDEIRAISVRQPFAISPDNLINLIISIVGLAASGGGVAFIVGLFHKAGSGAT